MHHRLIHSKADMPSIIPQPVSIKPGTGVFKLNAGTAIGIQPETKAIGKYLARLLETSTGLCLPVCREKQGGTAQIILHVDAQQPGLGAEGYVLDVTPAQIHIAGNTAAGVFYGVQTLLQLLPADVFRSTARPGVRWHVRSLRIMDYPRFAWRGLMLDTGRYYMPTHFLKRLFDLMALHKLNVFHWHLTEDQGWRLEIKRYPRLTSVGAWRAETVVDHENNRPQHMDGIPHGGFYTQDDVRELVEYARRRMITIVPEIEMPGHAQAAIAAYPELGNTGQRLPVSSNWGVHKNIFNAEQRTIRFLQNVLEETLGLFPGRFIHIGGDEAVKDQWKARPRAQALIRRLRLKDEQGLQSWFIRRMDRFLAARGRRLIGWDEILEGGLAKNAVVMSWRGNAGGIAAAKAGHDVVMAPNTCTYFDYYQSATPAHEPLAIGGCLPLEKAYAFEPVPPELNARQAQHILGAQGQLWTEYMPTPSHVEDMAFPRAAALAEVVWSPRRGKDYVSFLRRLKNHLKRLDVLDVNYRRSVLQPSDAQRGHP